MKRTALALILISAILFSSVIRIMSANAQFLGVVYINPDGSVIGTTLIQRNENIYTLTGNIGSGIQIQKSHIVLDGAGYAVKGNGEGRGIDLSNGRGQDPSRPEISNVTVKNLKILNFYYGVDNVNTHSNTFIGNYIENCLNSFWMGGYNNLITYNTMNNASIAINFAGSNNITRNNFINCWVMVWLSTQPIVDENYWSDYTTRYPGAIEIDNTGIWDTPYSYWENTVDNHPLTKPVDILLYDNSEGTHIYIRGDGSIEGTNRIQQVGSVYTLTGNISGSVIGEKDNIVINGAGYTLQGNGSGTGIYLDCRGNVTVKNLKIRGFGTGIDVGAATNNNLSMNVIVNNEVNGVNLDGDENSLCGNTIANNGNYGVLLYFSHYNIISGNGMTGNKLGIYLYGSTYNNISDNIIATNIDAGIWFFGSHYNKFLRNNVTDNQISMHFELQCLSNTIYQNNFINNDIEFLPDVGSVNFWDNGTVGNYWSAYLTKYPNATEIGNSGIGNTPYIIDANNIDHYPLMNPVAIPELPDGTGENGAGETEPFLTLMVVAVAVTIVAVGAVSLLVYFKKHQRDKSP